MNLNLLLEYTLIENGLLIGSVFILSCSVYYLFTKNSSANTNLPNNTEGLTNEEIRTIVNKNIQNKDAITDSDSNSSTDSSSTSNNDN
jgi:hypothetical protein